MLMEFSLREDISNGIEAIPVIFEAPTLTPQMAFKYVKTNVPGPECQKEFLDQFEGCSCQGVCIIEHCSCLKYFGCAYDVDGKIGDNIFEEPYTKPILECGNDCSCDSTLCHNRVVQKGIKNSLCVYHTKDKGCGLKLANSNSSKVLRGIFVCEYAGEVVGYVEARRRVRYTESADQDNYLIALREYVSGKEFCTYIDPRLFGNIGRFINHSCDPNLIMVPVRVNHQIPRLALFARKDIIPGEELTFDYSGKAAWNHLNSATNTEPVTLSSNCQNSLSESSHHYGTYIATMPHKRQDKNEERYFLETGLDYLYKKKNPTVPETSNVDLNSGTVFRVPRTGKSIYDRSSDQERVKYSTSSFNVDTQTTRQKPCYCGSINCSGFLPFDNKLLCD